jgi:hypothetical protein
MVETSRTMALLRNVSRRMRLAAFGRRFYQAFLIGCGLYAIALVAARLCGVANDWFTLKSLLAVSLAAAVGALIGRRRPGLVDAARVIDRQSGARDLFLTVALIDRTAGEFQPLVVRTAEEQTHRVRPAAVVPFHWRREAAQSAVALLLVVAGLHWLPQLDPFGRAQAATRVAQRQEQLAETKKATEARKAQLRKDEPEGPLSEETQKALENLKAALNKMQPKAREGNFKQLIEHQKVMGDKWRKLSAEKLRDLLSQNPEAQQFGAIDRDKLEKWTRELQEGSTRSLQQELDSLKNELKELAKTNDPVKKAELEQQIKKRMKELSSFATENVNSKPLAAALQRAMQQLEMSKLEGLDRQESLEAAEKSLDLSKMELKELAQSARDLKALEEALKVIQQARQLNDQEQLDGEMTEGTESLEEYSEFYAELMARLGLSSEDGEGDGDGDGLGGRGTGRGGKAPEDDSVETGFKTEQSKSAVTAGKVLLSVKTKGLSDRGDAKKEYREAIEKVKQGYSEAILQEQVPPGYYNGIKKYFDDFDKADAGEK